MFIKFANIINISNKLNIFCLVNEEYESVTNFDFSREVLNCFGDTDEFEFVNAKPKELYTDCDLSLFFIMSGGSEGAFLKYYPLLKEPFYFVVTGRNNGLGAALEILSFLNDHNKKVELIYGNIDHMTQRIRAILLENKKNG